MIKLTLIIWISCGLLSAGFFNAYCDDGYRWTTELKCKQKAATDQSFSLFLGVGGGPASLIVVLALTGFGYNGWSLYKHICNYS